MVRRCRGVPIQSNSHGLRRLKMLCLRLGGMAFSRLAASLARCRGSASSVQPSVLQAEKF